MKRKRTSGAGIVTLGAPPLPMPNPAFLAAEEERRLIIRYVHDVALHWQAEARRLAASNIPDASRYAAAKCAVLEGVAADLQDGVHTRRT